MKSFSDLEEVIKNGLCHKCGTCVAVCPSSALEIKGFCNIPILTGKCTQCGMCFNSCPGIGLDGEKIQKHVFNEIPKSEIGTVRKAFLGKAKNNRIRESGASGGVGTAIGIYLLEKKLVDEVILAGMKNYHPEPMITKMKEEIIDSSQSKYSLLSINKLLKNNKKRLAVFGLPCHINGIRKAELAKKKEMAEYRIGLFCGTNVPFRATEYLLKRLGIKDFNNIKKIEYRAGQWPGCFRITLKNESLKELPVHSFYALMPFFMEKRCRICAEFSNDFADISLGDAWIPEYVKEKEGWTLILARTEKGLKLIEDMKKEGYITIKQISENKAEKIINHQLKRKVIGNLGKNKILKKFGFSVPDYNFPHYRKNALTGFRYSIMFDVPRLLRPILHLVPVRFWERLVKKARKSVVKD